MNVRLEHLMVTNESKNAKNGADPTDEKFCALFTESKTPPDTLQINSDTFRLRWSSSRFNIYSPQ
jgi:hypothetical protein